SSQCLGVDSSRGIRAGGRIGSYILLSANGARSGEVGYARTYSSISELMPENIAVDLLYHDVDWLHWLALKPALSEDMADLMAQVLKEADQRGITISVDLNYRSKLWKYGKERLEIVPKVAAYCDVIIGNISAAQNMLDSPVEIGLKRQ